MNRGVLCGLLCVTASCSLSESYLVPSKAIELLSSQPIEARPRAQVPALRESDRSPVLIRYRALQWSEETPRTPVMVSPSDSMTTPQPTPQ